MTDYKAMYLLLFNAVTDALEKMDRQNYGEARSPRSRRPKSSTWTRTANNT